MSKCKCSGCGNTDFEVKNVNLPVKDIENGNITNKILELLPIKNDLFYIKICKKCGKTEFYNAAILEKNQNKKYRKY